jgi:hypothetical protein
VLAIVSSAAAQSPRETEYKIKAACVYNFLKFVEWPGHSGEAPSSNIVLAVVGPKDLQKTFSATLETGTPPTRLMKVVAYANLKDIPDLSKVHVLFVSADLERAVPDILAAVRGQPILTVGESPGFCEEGGMIRFHIVDNKVRFEVNLTESEKANLKISSKLLRLATNVIREDKSRKTVGLE